VTLSPLPDLSEPLKLDLEPLDLSWLSEPFKLELEPLSPLDLEPLKFDLEPLPEPSLEALPPLNLETPEVDS
jgi:hypothetical protein